MLEERLVNAVYGNAESMHAQLQLGNTGECAFLNIRGPSMMYFPGE